MYRVRLKGQVEAHAEAELPVTIVAALPWTHTHVTEYARHPPTCVDIHVHVHMSTQGVPVIPKAAMAYIPVHCLDSRHVRPSYLTMACINDIVQSGVY